MELVQIQGDRLHITLYSLELLTQSINIFTDGLGPIVDFFV